MGTEIMFFVERREHGQWTCCGEPFVVENGTAEVYGDNEFYDGRNSYLFAMLAGVGHGGINVIAPPRGLPDDLSAEIASIAEVVYEPETTASWLTLAELVAFDWDQTLVWEHTFCGPAYQQWIELEQERKRYPPGSYGFRKETHYVSEQEMAAAIEELKGSDPPDVWKPRLESALRDTWCKVTRDWTYAYMAENFHASSIPKMSKLGKPEDVRCVFWFC